MRNSTEIEKKIIKLEFESILYPYIKLLMKKNGDIQLKCLDVGCGDGVVLDALNGLRKKYKIKMRLYGIDLDKEALKSIKYKADLVASSATKMPFPDNFFDLIVCSQTLEHFTQSDLKKVLSQTFRVLKPGGFYYAETPNPESLLAKTMHKDWWMYLDEHLILIPASYAKKIMTKIGFKNIKVKTRMEIDYQINELKEIMNRLNNPLFKKLPMKIKAALIRNFCYHFNYGAVLICIAQK